MARMLGLLTAWWNAPDNYNWTTTYLASRSTLIASRVLIGSCAALMGLMGLFVLVLPYAPTSSIGTVLVWVLAAGAAGFALLWWTVEPRRSGSIAFLMYADVATTTVCTQLSDPVYAMFASSALIVGGSYATFFHGAKVLVAHVVWAAGTAAVLAVRVVQAEEAGPYVAVAMLALVAATNVAMPVFLQFGFWALRSDAADSFTDPLTGLLNRRGVYVRVTELTAPGSARSDDLVVFAIDLDRFKEINDSHGHSVGDEVLVRTARRIMAVAQSSALIARMGGEEFLVVDRIERADALGMAERIRHAIAASVDRAPTTASIGVACLAVGDMDSYSADRATVLDLLVETADSAMYRAKDAGRNTVVTDFAAPTQPRRISRSQYPR